VDYNLVRDVVCKQVNSIVCPNTSTCTGNSHTHANSTPSASIDDMISDIDLIYKTMKESGVLSYIIKSAIHRHRTIDNPEIDWDTKLNNYDE